MTPRSILAKVPTSRPRNAALPIRQLVCQFFPAQSSPSIAPARAPRPAKKKRGQDRPYEWDGDADEYPNNGADDRAGQGQRGAPPASACLGRSQGCRQQFNDFAQEGHGKKNRDRPPTNRGRRPRGRQARINHGYRNHQPVAGHAKHCQRQAGQQHDDQQQDKNDSQRGNPTLADSILLDWFTFASYARSACLASSRPTIPTGRRPRARACRARAPTIDLRLPAICP